MEVIVDTNVLVYETVEDSIYHEEVVEKLNRFSRIYISFNILIEFILVLKKLGLDEKFICDKVVELLDRSKIELVNVRKSDIERAIEIIIKEKSSMLRVNDKLVLSLALKLGIPLYTYDKQLKFQAEKFDVNLV
ncbi:MAG: PIN domain-containing protein [Nitrososphaeria archaeon]